MAIAGAEERRGRPGEEEGKGPTAAILAAARFLGSALERRRGWWRGWRRSSSLGALVPGMGKGCTRKWNDSLVVNIIKKLAINKSKASK